MAPQPFIMGGGRRMQMSSALQMPICTIVSSSLPERLINKASHLAMGVGGPRSRIGGAGDTVCPRGPVVPWSRLAPVWPRACPQPGLDHGSRDPESVARETPSVCPRGPVVPWSRGPVVPWSRGPVVPPGICTTNLDLVAPWSCGPVVPWSQQVSVQRTLIW